MERIDWTYVLSLAASLALAVSAICVQAAYDAGGPACYAAGDAAWALASTPPTTLTGVLAVLKFVSELDCGDWPEGEGLDERLLKTTAAAIETILGKGGV